MSSSTSRIPWWSIGAWSGLIAAVYVTRHLFFIFFMTFLFSYVIRRVTVGAMKLLSPDRDRLWLERVLVLGCFLMLALSVVVLVQWIGPKTVAQARQLIGVVKTVDPQREMHRALEQTVGRYLFRREYGGEDDPRYQKALHEFEQGGSEAQGPFQDFPHLEANLRGSFEHFFEQEARNRVRATLAVTALSGGKDPEARITEEIQALHHSPQATQRFREYYAERRADNPGGIPYDCDTFLRLREAYPKGLAAFETALGPATGGPASRARLEQGFRAAKLRELSLEWWSSDSAAAFLRQTVYEKSGSFTAALAGVFTAALGHLLDIPFELALALMLSLFLLLDFRTVRSGMRKLKESRLGPIYNEIAPGLVRLAQLIGKSFTAQAIIALVNALLSFIALEILGVDHAIVLSSLVFVCSFIPVLGVILSGIPMVVIAIVQPGGSVGLAFAVMVCILIIHLLETSVLDPKIMGKAIHLHPVLVLVVLLFAEQFFGVWGLILGAPVASYVLSAFLEKAPGPATAKPTS